MFKNRRETTQPNTVLDPNVIESLRDLDRKSGTNMLDQLIEAYIKTSPDLMQAIREAISNGDANAMQRAAHSFKTSNGSMGAMELASLCKQLDELGRAGTTQGAAELLPKMEVEYQSVDKALTDELHGGAMAPGKA